MFFDASLTNPHNPTPPTNNAEPGKHNAEQNVYIDLAPELKLYLESSGPHDYKNLKKSKNYNKIQEYYLTKLKELSTLTAIYFELDDNEAQNNEVIKSIKTFTEHIENPPKVFKLAWPVLYSRTRYHIYKIVSMLKQSLEKNTRKEAVVYILNENLWNIGLCADGAISHIEHAFRQLNALEENEFIRGVLKICPDYVSSFLAWLQCNNIRYAENPAANIPGMEIHAGNALLNILYKMLNFSLPIHDRYAYTPDGIIRKYFSDYTQPLIRFDLIRKIIAKYYKELTGLFKQHGVIISENIPSVKDLPHIDPNDKSVLHLDLMDKEFNDAWNEWVHAINQMAKSQEGNRLDIEDIANNLTTDSYQFICSYEKLLVWAAKAYFGSTLQVLQKMDSGKKYIGCAGDLFFWVFESNQEMNPGDVCSFKVGNYRRLQLSDLIEVNFAAFDYTTCLALLTQVLSETVNLKDMVFFLGSENYNIMCNKINREIRPLILEQVTQLLSDKISILKDGLADLICFHLYETGVLKPEQIAWLVNTPALEPVLCALKKAGINISSFVKTLSTQQVYAFERETRQSLLEPEHYQELIKQANRQRQFLIAAELKFDIYQKEKKLTQYPFSKEDLIELTESAIKGNHLDFFRELLKSTDFRMHGDFLLLAAKYGRVEYLKELQKFNVNINSCNKENFTPLMVAAGNGRVEFVNTLLTEKGIKINAANSQCHTALMLATKGGYVKCVSALLEGGANINLEGPYGYGLMHLAVMENRLGCINLLLKKGVDINSKDYGDFTPLHLAAKYGYVECVNRLLEDKNIDINAQGFDYNTALMLAIENGHTDCVNALLKAGAGFNVKNKSNSTAMHLAASNNRDKCIELLLEQDVDVNSKNNDGFTPLHLAVRNNHIECVNVLLTAKDINIDAQDQDHCTALMTAFEKNHVECTSILLEAGADFNVKGINNNTIMHFAALNGRDECVNKLLEKGFKVNSTNNSGETPLHLAVRNNHIECVNVLLTAKDIDIDAQNQDHFTALIIAAQRGCVECAEALLKAGADFNVKGTKNYTAVHFAALNNRDECIKLLLKEENVDVNSKTAFGETPLHVAVANNHIKCVNALLEAKDIDIYAQNEQTSNALAIALQKNHVECVDALIEADDKHKVADEMNGR